MERRTTSCYGGKRGFNLAMRQFFFSSLLKLIHLLRSLRAQGDRQMKTNDLSQGSLVTYLMYLTSDPTANGSSQVTA